MTLIKFKDDKTEIEGFKAMQPSLDLGQSIRAYEDRKYWVNKFQLDEINKKNIEYEVITK